MYSTGLHIFLENNAVPLRRAVEAGAEEIQPPTDMFYGANSASVRDPFGHVWVLLSWKQDPVIASSLPAPSGQKEQALRRKTGPDGFTR